MIKRISVVHPGKQKSYVLAKKLHELNELEFFYTSLYFKKTKGNLFLAKTLFKPISKALNRRTIPDLPDDKVRTCMMIRSINMALIARLKKPKLYFKVNNHFNYVFGRKVAKKILKSKSDIVISSANNSFELFKKLKESKCDISCVLEMPTLPAAITSENFKNSLVQKCEYNPTNDFGQFLDDKYVENCKSEYDLADYFLASSNVVKNGLIKMGYRPENIFVIHYPPEMPTKKDFLKVKFSDESHPLNIVYVGNVTGRKGIHLLLESIKSFKENEVKVSLVGEYSKSLYKHYKHMHNVSFVGKVEHGKVFDILMDADLFVFPSLSDGFGFAVVEAMQLGIPVLCSVFAGVSDYFDASTSLFNPIDLNNLQNIIKKIISDKSVLYRMSSDSKNAYSKMLNEDYQSSINEFTKVICEKEYE